MSPKNKTASAPQIDTAPDTATSDPAHVPVKDAEAPVPTGPRAVAAPNGGLSAMTYGEGMEETLISDLIVPRTHLVQPGNDDIEAEGAHAGSFRDNLGVERAELHVALLVARHGQVRWGDFGGENKMPLCRSNDALAPHPDVEQPFGQICNRKVKGRLAPVCPEACWQNKDGKRAAPRCSFLYATVMWDLDSDSPFLMRFARTGLRVVQMCLTRIWQLRASIYEVDFRIKTVKRTDPKIFYVPVVAEAKKIDDEGRRKQLRAAWQSAGAFEIDVSNYSDQEAESEAATESGNGGGGGNGEDIPF